MSKLIRLKIDVKKIIREAMFKANSGALYLDASFFLNDEPDQYGNHGMIVQDLGKEARERGEKGPILGNAKLIVTGGQQRQHQQPQQQRQQPQRGEQYNASQREQDDFNAF